MSEEKEQKLLYDPMEHPEWLAPHSRDWYLQLDSEVGEYKYPWKSQFEEPTAEMIYEQKILSYLTKNSRVLDVGCGHGEFTMQFASEAKEIIGIDIREGFISKANKMNTSDKVRFLTINVDDGLPFPDEYFDLVYSKKGPWLYHEANHEGYRILKPGGIVMEFKHRGTGGGLREHFPGLYSPLPDNWLDMIKAECERTLAESRLTGIDFQLIEETEYLATPEDVLIKKCFGQNKNVKEFVWRECLGEVEKIFYKNATPKGLKVTNYYHIITAMSK